MPDKTYKLIEIVGVSDQSIQQAVRNGLAKAGETLRNIDWFEVTTIRGAALPNGEPIFQVQMKVGFRLLERSVLDEIKLSTSAKSSSQQAGEQRKKTKTKR